MRLGWIALTGFRSHASLEWSPDPATNLIVGRNGAGKTSLLEAVGYLGTMRSFRGAPDEALVAFDVESAIDRGEVTSEESTTLIEVEIRRRGGRRALLNRSRLPRVTDLLGHVRVVAFLPDDLEMVKGGPGKRRDLLDELAVQLWPASHLDQTDFDRALRQRNAFLRQGDHDQVTLSVWDERLALAGGKVMSRRARAAELLIPQAESCYQDVAGAAERLALTYRSGWGGELLSSVSAAEFTERYREALGKGRKADRDRRITLLGPHRDEPGLELDEHDLRYHGSQGEQRTAALGIRLASRAVIEEQYGSPPLLLLDDVFSELDSQRSEALARALPDHGQSFISTADRADVPLDGKVWSMDHGALV